MARPAAQRREMVIIRPGKCELSYADFLCNRVTEFSTLEESRQQLAICLGRNLGLTFGQGRRHGWLVLSLLNDKYVHV